MLSILTPELRTAEIKTAPERAAPEPESTEFEIVLGRRQVASLLFVATVMIVVFSAVSYLAGKAMSPDKAIDSGATVARPAPMVEATIVSTAEPAKAALVSPVQAAQPEPPLFAEPATGAVYLQMGAVEKGIAVILTEGLRKRGFQAFAAAGPHENVFRVLIGPLPDAEAFQRTKDALHEIGLSIFVRRYEK
jgi:cell division septation protein DedD